MSVGKRKVDAENRQFQEQWTEKYFFVDNNSAVTCLICQFTVSVCKEYNIKRHFESKHQNYLKLHGDERTKKIENLKRSLSSQKTVFQKQFAQYDACVEVSLNVAELIAKSGRPFSDGEFGKRCIMIAATKVCPEAVNKFENISLSRRTIQRRILDLSKDLSEQMQHAASNFVYYSLALDESTDITSTAQLLVFIRGVSSDFKITEELLGMHPMKDQTTGAEILTCVLNLCEQNKLDLTRLVSVATDGAPSMAGKNNGMVSLLKANLGQREIELMHYHCIIHQQQLCAKELGFDLLMNVVSDSINFIRSRGLNHRQFKALLEETESQHHDVVYYTEVRWLSRAVALKRFLDVIEDVIAFLDEKGRSTRKLKEPSFQCDLSFLVDITSHLNDLNLKLQGKNKLIFQLVNNISAFKQKLQLFHSHMCQQNFAHFPHCQQFKTKFPQMKFDYSHQITQLIESFNKRFTQFEAKTFTFNLFSDPFSTPPQNAPEEVQLELIDLQNCDIQKKHYKENDLLQFYNQLPEEFPNLKKNAAICASMFGSTYICEQAFSVMNNNKSKLRSKLTDENLNAVLRLATTNMEADVKKIASNIQAQPSH